MRDQGKKKSKVVTLLNEEGELAPVERIPYFDCTDPMHDRSQPQARVGSSQACRERHMDKHKHKPALCLLQHRLTT